MPAAEVEIGHDLVRRLLTDQHRDLADLPLLTVGNGWDNVVVRVGRHLAVRLPRREAAAVLLEHEQSALPAIAHRVGVTVPVPVRLGHPTGYFPWSWSVVRWVEGRPAADLPVRSRSSWAARLATFAARLHEPAPPDAPANPLRGTPLEHRDAVVRRRLAGAGVPRAAELAVLWDRLLATPPHAGPARWLHGDLHPGNIVVHRGRLAAVVDFGDVTGGDPATDLAAAWLCFDLEGRAAFVVRYSQLAGADEALWLRGRAWALVLATALLERGGREHGLEVVGSHAVRELLDAPDALGRFGRP